jgi:molybdopterin-containing oxidoreductase family membrane subunit
LGCICNLYVSSVSVFWWTGLLPDFAMLRDRAITFNKRVYSIFLDGAVEIGNVLRKFRCSAGLATPLYFLHTIVSMDFATSVIPGWHTTIFLLTVAGAVFRRLIG